MAAEPIRIEGLKEFTRAVRRLDKDAAKAMRAGFKDAASIIVADAKPKVPVGPGIGGHASKSIKPSTTGGGVSVTEGGNRYPYMPWLDFGGKVGRNNSVTRPFIKEGRYIWSSFSDKHQQVMDKIEESIRTAAESAGLELS